MEVTTAALDIFTKRNVWCQLARYIDLRCQ